MTENGPYAYIQTNRLTGLVFIDDEHTVLYCVGGEFHSVKGPAVAWTDGTRLWYRCVEPVDAQQPRDRGG